MDYYHQSDSPDWPHNTSTHIFLARACAQLGKALFGELWGFRVPDPDDDDSDEVIERYKEWERLEDQAEIDAANRIKRVQKTLSAWARSGRLQTALRAKVGGEIIKQKALVWNCENYLHRFAECEMSLRDLFRVSENGTHYIFVKTASFKNCLREMAPQGQVESPMARRAKASPALDAAIALLRIIWKDNIPEYLTAGQASPKIKEWMKKNPDNLHSEPTSTTLARALEVVKRP